MLNIFVRGIYAVVIAPREGGIKRHSDLVVKANSIYKIVRVISVSENATCFMAAFVLLSGE